MDEVNYHEIDVLENPSNSTFMSDISTDNSILALSTDNSGLRIYTNNGSHFKFSQTLQNVSADIEGIDLTGDG